MPLIVIASLVGLVYFAIRFGFVPPPGSATLIRIRDGMLEVRRGQIQPHAKEYIADILREAGVSRGFIAISRERRIAFSRQIPVTVHQALRNVLLS
jgi:hypothetical protein